MKIIEASKSDLKGLALIFAEVFEDSPVVAHIAHNPIKRQKVNRWLNQRILAYGYAYGTVFTDEQKTGASALMPVNGRSITIPRMIKLGLLEAPFRMGLGGFRRFLKYASLTDKVHGRHMSGPHYVELATAVERTTHDMGMGSAMTMAALIRAGFDVADTAGLACYTETVFEHARDWYVQFGYEVVEEVELPGIGPMWALVRQPDSKSSTS